MPEKRSPQLILSNTRRQLSVVAPDGSGAFDIRVNLAKLVVADDETCAKFDFKGSIYCRSGNNSMLESA